MPRRDAALDKRPGDPVSAVKGFFGVTLDRIADPLVPGGCLLAQSAAEAPTLSGESQELVRVLLACPAQCELPSVVGHLPHRRRDALAEPVGAADGAARYV